MGSVCVCCELFADEENCIANALDYIWFSRTSFKINCPSLQCARTVKTREQHSWTIETRRLRRFNNALIKDWWAHNRQGVALLEEKCFFLYVWLPETFPMQMCSLFLHSGFYWGNIKLKRMRGWISASKKDTIANYTFDTCWISNTKISFGLIYNFIFYHHGKFM